jgi:hypothetical protein
MNYKRLLEDLEAALIDSTPLNVLIPWVVEELFKLYSEEKLDS